MHHTLDVDSVFYFVCPCISVESGCIESPLIKPESATGVDLIVKHQDTLCTLQCYQLVHTCKVILTTW